MCAVFSAGLACGGTYLALGNKLETARKYAVLAETEDFLESVNYPDFNRQNAVSGYISGGGDKWTRYTPDDEIASAENYVNTSGTAAASGFQIQLADSGNILVSEVTKNLAMYNCGVREGDEISAIDGENVIEAGFENISSKLLGKQDTQCRLEILRDGKTFNFTFTRDNEYQREMAWKKLNNFGYLDIDHVNMFTDGYIKKALDEIGDVDGYILDLRDNTGGATESTVEGMDYLVGENNVTLTRFDGTDFAVYETHDGDDYEGKPIVVLVNPVTASSAEIMTALAKQAGGTVIGEKTVGKGVFQTDKTLKSGGSLHYTAGTYTVGDWECYHGVGIQPDIEIQMDYSLIGTDDDIQLKKALEILK